MKKIIFFFLVINGLTAISQTNDFWNEELHHKSDGEKIYIEKETDHPPRLVYGINGFNRFIARNLKIPNEDIPVGEIICSAIIELDGTMSDIKVLNEVPDSFKKEALRVLKLFKEPWYPAIKNDQAVRCQYIIPIVFKMI